MNRARSTLELALEYAKSNPETRNSDVEKIERDLRRVSRAEKSQEG